MTAAPVIVIGQAHTPTAQLAVEASVLSDQIDDDLSLPRR
jgi:hypothetical protein